MKDHDDEKCEVFDSSLIEGCPNNLGIQIQFSSLPNWVEDFVGRVKEIQEIV